MDAWVIVKRPLLPIGVLPGGPYPGNRCMLAMGQIRAQTQTFFRPLRDPFARPACNHLWGLVLAITVSHGSMVSSAAWRSSLRRDELSQFGSVVPCRHRAACVANIDSEGEIAAALSEAYGGCKARKPYTGAACDEVREYDRHELTWQLAVILDSLIGTEVSHGTCAT